MRPLPWSSLRRNYDLRLDLARSMRGQVRLEPATGMISDGFDGAGLGEQMSGARDDLEAGLDLESSQRPLVELEHDSIVDGDAKRRRRTSGREARGCQSW